MATYTQARRLLDEETKRAYLLYGPDRVLVEDFVDDLRKKIDPHDVDYFHLSAREVKPAQLWAVVDQYSVDPHSRRLAIVRDSEAIKNWQPLIVFLDSRLQPNTTVIFIHNEDVDTSLPHFARIVKSGRLVKCGPTNDADAHEYLSNICPIDQGTVTHLMERVGGNLSLAANCLKKARLLGGIPSTKHIDLLTEPSPDVDFELALVANDRPRASRLAGLVPDSDVSRTIGSVDYTLEQLFLIHQSTQRRQSIRDTITSTKIPAFVLQRLIPHAKHYDRGKVLSCRKVLAVADDLHSQGAGTLALQVLALTW